MWSSARTLRLNLPDTGRWLWSYYASRLPGARDARCVQVAVLDGAGKKHRVLIRQNGYDWAVLEEVFIRDVYRVDLTNVKHILDLGGNIGLAALSFAWNFPDAQICTVEPMPENLAVLRRNVELNRAPVRVVAAAAGTNDGQARFNFSEDPRRHSKSLVARPTERLVEVNVLSVPCLMKLMDWEDIDLLKIDIEGGEKDLLSGQPSWLKKVRCIIGEGACRRGVHHRGVPRESRAIRISSHGNRSKRRGHVVPRAPGWIRFTNQRSTLNRIVIVFERQFSFGRDTLVS